MVQLLDADGSVLMEASPSAGGSSLRYRTTRPGSYFLQVTLPVDAGREAGCPYELHVGVPDEDG